MKNPIKSYVPIIRWRPAETRALKHLFSKDRTNITPLFEFILPPPKIDKTDYKKILEDSKTKFLRNLPEITSGIIEHWGKEPFFVDVHLLDGDIRANAFESILTTANQSDLFSIPVTYIIPTISTDADIETRKIATKFAKSNDRGLCIRIDDSHLNNETAKKIKEFIKDEGLDHDKIDLLVDLKIVDKQMTSQNVASKLSLIPDIDKWRSVILTGGSFPRDLSDYGKHEHHKIDRYDWKIWKDIFENKSIPRKPLFSDYTIQHPIYYGHLVGVNTSASIRYTNEETWEVLRGEGLRNKKGAGYKQYPAQAKLLTEQDFFKGKDFSFGDGYIYGKADGDAKTTGSPQTWLTAGINHHITMVINQLSNLLSKSK
jgi:Beta protein